MTENNENKEIFIPKRTKIDRDEAVNNLPSNEDIDFEITEIVIDPDTSVIGIYEDIFDRTLQKPNKFTGMMVDHQVGMLFKHSENEHLMLNEDEKESLKTSDTKDTNFFRYVWCSNGLLRALDETEIGPGQRIKIKRKGEGIATRWTIIPLGV